MGLAQSTLRYSNPRIVVCNFIIRKVHVILIRSLLGYSELEWKLCAEICACTEEVAYFENLFISGAKGARKKKRPLAPPQNSKSKNLNVILPAWFFIKLGLRGEFSRSLSLPLGIVNFSPNLCIHGAPYVCFVFYLYI